MLARASAKRRIDARGLVVAPGVIDIQAHSEEQLLYGDSRVMGMITQGVTTMIMGEGETPGQMSQTMFNDYLKAGDTTHAALYPVVHRAEGLRRVARRHGASHGVRQLRLVPRRRRRPAVREEHGAGRADASRARHDAHRR